MLNDKSRMKGDFHVRFREKFEVKVLLLTRLRGRRLITASYSTDGGDLWAMRVILYKENLNYTNSALGTASLIGVAAVGDVCSPASDGTLGPTWG